MTTTLAPNSELAPDSETGRRVDIRIRRTLARDGSESSQLTVFCPLRRVSLSIEDCQKCEACEQVSIDPAERSSFVTCRYAPGPRDVPGSTRLPASIRGHAVDPLEGLRTRLGQLMTRSVICVRPDVSLNDLTMILFEHGISGAPVVDPSGKPLGVVSKTDLLRDSYEKVEIAEDKSARGGLLDSDEHHGSRLQVKDIMSTSVSSLPESATLAEAAALMALEAIRRIPILNERDEVVGIVCASDILGWLARQAGYVVPARSSMRR